MKEKIIYLFGQISGTYDSERKALIPCFDDFYTVIVELAETENIKPNILDIGAGTGLLTHLMLAKYPKADCSLIDISDEMLLIAKKRFAGCKNIKYINGDYEKYQFTSKFDIIVSALSIHHLSDEGKAGLYKKIYTLLNNNGIFINGDQFLSPNNETEKLYQKNWLKKIDSSGLADEQKKGAYNRMKLDKPASINDNIKWLVKAGFKDVDIFYKYYNFGVIAGRK
ncbi:MAG: class I SAM-dependent methyltransferase [Spirochaetes bacterium]|nr:class I SAM-dependent methyltransferase [Spirochaetota bacterium]